MPVCVGWIDEIIHIKWTAVHTNVDTRKNVWWQRQRRQKVKRAEVLSYSAVDIKELFALKTLCQQIKAVTFPSKAYGKKACDISLNLWRAESVGSYPLKGKLWHSLPLVHQIKTTSFVSESSSFANFWVFWEYSREMLINICSVSPWTFWPLSENGWGGSFIWSFHVSQDRRSNFHMSIIS